MGKSMVEDMDRNMVEVSMMMRVMNMTTDMEPVALAVTEIMEDMERVIIIRDKRVADTSTKCTRRCTTTTKVVIMVINQPQRMAILTVLLTTLRKVIKRLQFYIRQNRVICLVKKFTAQFHESQQ